MVSAWGPLLRGVVVASVGLLLVALWTRRYRHHPSVSTYLLVVAGLGVAGLVTAVGGSRAVKSVIAVMIVGYLPVAWAVFAFGYNGVRQLTRRRYVALVLTG